MGGRDFEAVTLTLAKYYEYVAEHRLPEDQRIMPETRPDAEAAEHRLMCMCRVCKRPAARKVKQLAARRRREAKSAENLAPAAPRLQ